MAKMPVSDEAQNAAGILAALLKLQSIRSFELLVVPQRTGVPPSILVQGKNKAVVTNLFVGDTPRITVDDLEELAAIGLLDFQPIKYNPYSTIYRVRLKQELSSIVDSKFEVPLHTTHQSTIQISSANIVIERASIHDLTDHPDLLAEAIVERLLPELSKQEAFTMLEITELREAIESLREASSLTETEQATRRIWDNIGRSADFLTLLQMFAAAVLAR